MKVFHIKLKFRNGFYDIYVFNPHYLVLGIWLKSPKVLKILNMINPTTNIGRNFMKLVLKSIFVSFMNFNVSNGINNIKRIS